MEFNIATYIRDKLLYLFITLLCALIVFAMVVLQGVTVQGALVISGLMLICALLISTIDYIRKKKFYHELSNIASGLEKSYHAGGLLDEPDFLEGEITYEAMDMLSRQSGNELAKEKDALGNYHEYIELWIHEVKTPIAAMKLALERLNGDEADNLSKDIERIEAQVEQALYYARMSTLKNDYMLSVTHLREVVNDAVKQNRHLLISSGISINVDIDDSLDVISDDMWLGFIIKQIIVNSAKYGADRIEISAKEENRGTPREHTLLEIEDNGWGIPAKDLPMVFERAFTGENGRTQGNATGMGLYLVANMCDRMGLGIAIKSEQGQGTSLYISFPHDFRLKDR